MSPKQSHVYISISYPTPQPQIKRAKTLSIGSQLMQITAEQHVICITETNDNI